ncbi:MAG TPA: ChaN family lipoprotein [Anditalea sp.]|nr:ChaN family lipoprotein [Anditalea sp.]
MAQLTPYKIFDKEGQEVAFEDMSAAASKHQVILFGELHNNSLVHWLQLQLLKELAANHDGLVLGGEFFEADDQLNLDEWFSGKINDKNFEAEAKLWNNYIPDYKPLMNYALNKGIPFIATNIPRKYASAVSRGGIDVLNEFSNEAKQYMAPLPIEVDKELPGYAAMAEMMHGSGMNADNMIAAQASKDATMAHFILEGLRDNQLFLHINGAYHSNDYEGIVWYLKHYSPEIKIMTITTIEQEDIKTIEEQSYNKADFIILLPADSPKSY